MNTVEAQGRDIHARLLAEAHTAVRRAAAAPDATTAVAILVDQAVGYAVDDATFSRLVDEALAF
jgi:hypothetical protein